MIIHYDRVPTLPRGRHGSRVQRANHRRRTRWQVVEEHLAGWQALEQHLLRGSEQHPWYDPDGKPIGMLEASLLLHDIDARRIGLDYIGDYEVSTVHMPDVFQYTDDGQPLMFETMVFRDGQAEQRWLTTTKERARQQHAQVCNMAHRGELTGRAEDDEDRAELADLLGADMVGKLLEGDQG